MTANRMLQEIPSIKKDEKSKLDSKDLDLAFDRKSDIFLDVDRGRTQDAIVVSAHDIKKIQKAEAALLSDQKQQPVSAYFQIKKIPEAPPKPFSIEHLSFNHVFCCFRKKLGEGGYGVVYKGQYNNVAVAIKESKKSTNIEIDEAITIAFHNESKVYAATFGSPYIVRYIGYADSILVTEFMPNKSLHTYLKDHPREMDWLTKIKIIFDVASALSCLHGKQYTYADLTSANVLLDKDLRAKLVDFGLTENTGTVEYKRRFRIISPWMAPEMQRGSTNLTSMDIYSLGYLIGYLAEGDFYKNCPPEIMALMDDCRKKNPSDRLTISQVLLRLVRILNQPGLLKAPQAVSLDIKDSENAVLLPPLTPKKMYRHCRLFKTPLDMKSPVVLEAGSIVIASAIQKNTA